MGYAIQKSVNFRLSEVTFDGFWVPVRLVAEILLHVEIHLTSIRPDIWGGDILPYQFPPLYEIQQVRKYVK